MPKGKVKRRAQRLGKQREAARKKTVTRDGEAKRVRNIEEAATCES